MNGTKDAYNYFGIYWEILENDIETDAIIGGEESGGYAFRGHVPERDGILARLLFLDFMVKTKLKPSQLLAKLFEKVGPHYYDRIDTIIEASQKDGILKRIKENQPKKLGSWEIAKVNLADGFKFILSDGSWLLIRFSGTEPLVRIYSEASSKEQVRAILDNGKKLVHR